MFTILYIYCKFLPSKKTPDTMDCHVGIMFLIFDTILNCNFVSCIFFLWYCDYWFNSAVDRTLRCLYSPWKIIWKNMSARHLLLPIKYDEHPYSQGIHSPSISHYIRLILLKEYFLQFSKAYFRINPHTRKQLYILNSMYRFD